MNFKDYIMMEAYTNFPKSVSDIKKLNFDNNITDDIINLFNYLTNISNIKEPLAIQIKTPKNIKVSRQFQGIESIKEITAKSQIKDIKISFGNGSNGNRGVNNRGNLFEGQFATALEYYRNSEIDKIPKDMLAAIDDLDSIYNIKTSKKFQVNVVGGENTKRPLKYSPIELTNPGSGYNIGKAVTDVTLELDSGNVFLSLKLGGTTTFFNSGIKKVLKKSEIKSGMISNKDGLELLELLGIDNQKFCEIFNAKIPNGSIDRNAKTNKKGLEKLLQSGIGYGYHIIHKMSKYILSKEMDNIAMKKAAKLTSNINVYYGGKTGKGKRVDIEFTSGSYKFKLNIRDSQGGDGYPTRLMCDFIYI